MIPTPPEGVDIVFENLGEGDEDFFSEQSGHLNISLAYRQLKLAGARMRDCHVPRADLPKYREVRDIDQEHVERLKQDWKEHRWRPVLLGELEPGKLTLIDGIHRVMACADMEPEADPIILRGYIVPHRCLELIKIRIYYQHPDGRKEDIDTKQFMPEIWGKYTSPEDGQRSPI